MPKRHKISSEELENIQKARKENKDKRIEKRLEILELHAQGMGRAEISKRTGYSKQGVTQVVGKYSREGLDYLQKNHYGGNHRNMNFDAEKAVLEPFTAKAKAGQIIETGEILEAYQQATGRKSKSRGHIYTILKRHGWRKVMPRSRHPNKASEEVISTSKKLTIGWTNCELSTMDMVTIK